MALENKLGLDGSADLAREEERTSKKKAAHLTNVCPDVLLPLLVSTYLLKYSSQPDPVSRPLSRSPPGNLHTVRTYKDSRTGG